MKITKKTLEAIISVAVLIVLIVIIFIVVHFSNGNGFTHFYVTNGKTEFMPNNENTLQASAGQSYYFTCNYTIKGNGFEVRIVPNESVADFEFTVDGMTTTFKEITDLSVAFNIEKTAKGFVLYLPQDLSMQTVLSKLYVDRTVVVPLGIELGGNFSIKVVPNNAEVVKINLVFRGLEQ